MTGSARRAWLLAAAAAGSLTVCVATLFHAFTSATASYEARLALAIVGGVTLVVTMRLDRRLDRAIEEWRETRR